MPQQPASSISTRAAGMRPRASAVAPGRASALRVAVRMDDHGGLERVQPRRLPAVERLLEQQHVAGDRARVVVAGQELHELVAQRQDARRLEADDRHAAGRERQQPADVLDRQLPRLVEHAGRDVGAAAADVRRDRRVGAGGVEVVERGEADVGLEPLRERVDEQRDVDAARAVAALGQRRGTCASRAAAAGGSGGSRAGGAAARRAASGASRFAMRGACGRAARGSRAARRTRGRGGRRRARRGCASRCCALIQAMSTPAGHSVRQALQPMQVVERLAEAGVVERDRAGQRLPQQVGAAARR